MALVEDEHGTVAGVVTLKNVLEPIVGAVEDEFGDESPPIVDKLQKKMPTPRVTTGGVKIAGLTMVAKEVTTRNRLHDRIRFSKRLARWNKNPLANRF